jgi:hypothetical protein
MKVLVACECSGRVRDAFIAQGHEAMSCDLQPDESNGPHYQGDVRDVLGAGWDLMIAHPPCTYLSRAGARWWKEPGRLEKAEMAAGFVRMLWQADIEHIAIENPIGQLNKMWRYPDQVIQPWWFGDPWTKATCLWLKNLPPLMATCYANDAKPLLPSNTGAGKRAGQRWAKGAVHNAKDASRTLPGIAKAMAHQWSSFLLENKAA